MNSLHPLLVVRQYKCQVCDSNVLTKAVPEQDHFQDVSAAKIKSLKKLGVFYPQPRYAEKAMIQV